MILKYFVRDFYLEAKQQRKKMLSIYYSIVAIYIIISLAFILWYKTLPYEDEKIILIKVLHYSITAFFIFISIVFLGIKFKRVNKYYKKCIDVETGLTETATGSFIDYNESIQSKDGVDFKTVIFLELNKKRDTFFERKVLVLYEKPFPEFSAGQNVRYTTQGNVLKHYEILDESNETEGE